MCLGTHAPYGAKWVPEGADRPCLGQKGYQKARNIRPEGSKKVVWSASLACFTITHFSVAKTILTKYDNTFQMCFTFDQLTLGQSSPRLGGKTYGGMAHPGRN